MQNNKIKVTIGKPTGFCSGVKRAIALVKQQAQQAKNGTSVYTLGPIIHNSEVVNELKQLGVKTISNIKGLKPNTNNKSIVIIRTHGCAPEGIAKIKKLGYKVIDATCPYVRRVQNYALKFKNDGYTTIVVGDKHHPEVKGILAYAKPQATVYDMNSRFKVQGSKNWKLEIGNWKFSKIGIIGQTTIPSKLFQDAVSSFNFSDYQEIRIFNTLCKESLNRQKICKKIADEVDLMIVIGSKKSANTLTLVDIAKSNCSKVYLVENKKDLRNWKLEKRNNLPQMSTDEYKYKREKRKYLCKSVAKNYRVGVIAGASTPQNTVFEVVQEIKKITTKGETH